MIAASDITQRQLDALVSLAHTVDMWREYGSDTELLDELAKQETLLRPLMTLRGVELRQRITQMDSEEKGVGL